MSQTCTGVDKTEGTLAARATHVCKIDSSNLNSSRGRNSNGVRGENLNGGNLDSGNSNSLRCWPPGVSRRRCKWVNGKTFQGRSSGNPKCTVKTA